MVAADESMMDVSTVEDGGPSYEDKCGLVTAIAKPLAPKKLSKKLFKCCKAGAKSKGIRRGTKEVAKSLRKGEKGFVIIAGDVSPIDVISHLPVVCEQSKIPYVYVPSKSDLGSAIGSKSPASIVLILKGEEYKDKYKECVKSIKELPSIFV